MIFLFPRWDMLIPWRVVILVGDWRHGRLPPKSAAKSRLCRKWLLNIPLAQAWEEMFPTAKIEILLTAKSTQKQGVIWWNPLIPQSSKVNFWILPGLYNLCHPVSFIWFAETFLQQKVSQKWLMFIKHTAKNKQLELPSFHVLLGPCRSDLGLLEGYVSWGGKTVVEGLKLANPAEWSTSPKVTQLRLKKPNWKIRPLIFFKKRFRFLDSVSVYHTICEICPIWVIFVGAIKHFSSQQGFDLRLIRHHWSFFLSCTPLFHATILYNDYSQSTPPPWEGCS